MITLSSASMPWTWNTDLAMSRPTVVIICMLGSSESWLHQQQPSSWHSRAGGGAVHSITSGHSVQLWSRGRLRCGLHEARVLVPVERVFRECLRIPHVSRHRPHDVAAIHV